MTRSEITILERELYLSESVDKSTNIDVLNNRV